MDDEMIILKHFLTGIMLIVIVFICTFAMRKIHEDYQIGKAIEKGADPVVARMAYENGGYTERLLYLLDKKYDTKSN